MIQLTPDIMRTNAAEIRTLRGQHDDTMARIKTLVRSLNESWKGSAAEAYVSKFDGMQSTFTNFSEMLEDIAEKLEYNANEMEKRDLELAAQNRN